MTFRFHTRQAPTRIGPDGELFMAPALTTWSAPPTTLYGFLDAAPETDSACAPVWAMFDNEEVGSSTRQGADSSFLRDVLDRILNAIPTVPSTGPGICQQLCAQRR